MSDQYIGEIRAFACNYAPYSWAQCNGQLIAIRQNTALYSLLGNTYGGDGVSTFGLPNLQGRAAIGQGQLAGGSTYPLGSTGGASSVTLQINQMPTHNHQAMGTDAGDNPSPVGQTWGNMDDRPAPNYFADALGNPQNMNPQAFSNTGNGQPHNNLMPFQTVNFCIALQGIYPEFQ